ncbi:SET and MYND domain-containing protein 4-like [Culicoides brevitarsis]|uniref:SET and MYND domain-containing protein 4-like n=1 Tax=Culicoides brevitarsis TaxID=469753 RepID=UPI00307BD489
MQSEFLGRKDSEKAFKILIRADRHFRNFEYEKAIEAYNAAICHAFLDTPEMRNGFYGRALVFEKIGLYDEALRSLRKALDIKQSIEEANQLNCLKDKILWLKEKNYKVPKAQKKLEPVLSHKALENVPFASELIEIQENAQFGRYLTAKKDLTPGEIILIEDPICQVLDREFIYKKCTHCLRSNNFDLIPCDKCSVAMFCDENNCRASRHNFHKYECKIMMPIINILCDEGRLPWISLRLLLMTLVHYDDDVLELAKLSANEEQQHRIQFKKFNYQAATGPEYIRYVLNLAMKHVTDADEDAEIRKMSLLIVELLLKRTPEFKKFCTAKELLTEILVKFFLINMANNFVLTSYPTWQEKSDALRHELFGSALYPFTSLINHACVPNLKVKFIGESNSRVMIYVTRPIKAGEQLFICYKKTISYLFAEKTSRQQVMQADYGFECCCEACSRDYLTLKNLPRIESITEDEQNLLENAASEVRTNIDAAKKCLPKIVTMIEKYNSSFPSIECYQMESMLEYCISTMYRNRPLMYE